MEIYAWIESVFQIAVQYGILAMEALGMAVLLVTAARSAKGWLTGDPHVRLTLAQGIALSLEFKLGSEVLRTVVVRDWSELGILGAVIAEAPDHSVRGLVLYFRTRQKTVPFYEKQPEFFQNNFTSVPCKSVGLAL